MTQFRYPHITGKTPEEQLEQLKSYLRQLVDQLNMMQRSEKDGVQTDR